MTATKIQPVAEICSASHDDAEFGERAIKPLRDISDFEYGTPLYAGAAPAAVAPQGDKDDSLLLCASDLQHSAIYDSHSEMQDCARSVADRIKALAAPALEAPGAPVGSARQFIEWMYSQPEDREPTTAEGALLEFEAHLAAAAPQAPAAPAVDAWLQPDDMAALQRFHETAEDDESYDIGKEAVARLCAFGCLQSHSFGRYSTTDFGDYLLDTWAGARTLPFTTAAEREALAAQAAAKGEHDAAD